MLPLQLAAWSVLFKPLATSCSSLLSMASKLCDSCGGYSESHATRASKLCDSCFRADEAFRVRIYRALKDLKGYDPSIVTDFNKFSRPEKAKFKQEHQDKSGKRLKMTILEEVIIKRTTQSMQTALAEGHMNDEVDLTEKYGNKPEQLVAIKQNAYSSMGCDEEFDKAERLLMTITNSNIL